MRLLTNNPRKVVGLEAYGIRVVDRVPIQIASQASNRRYLETKREKLGHLLVPEGPALAPPPSPPPRRATGARKRRSA